MLTPFGVGFYSNMIVMVFGDTAGDVDEVMSPRFFIVSPRSVFGLEEQKLNFKNIKKMKTRILLITTLLFAVFANLRAQVVFNVTNFPDANFREYLMIYFSSKGFTRLNVTISAANLNSITEINVGNRNVTNLTGIEHFTQLKKLVSTYYGLVTINLSQNTELETLICQNTNYLTELDLTKCTKLKTLDCQHSKALTKLDLSKNVNLETVDCSNTSNEGYGVIASIDVSKCTKLKILKFSFQPVAKIDVSNSPLLTILDCHNCYLQSLDVTKNPVLTYLDCSEQKAGYPYNTSYTIRELDVSKNLALTHLDCHDNSFSDPLDVSKNTALTYLDCYRCSLREIDVTKNTNLTHLDCGANSLSELDVTQNLKLNYLLCSRNNLSTLDVTKLNLLDSLYCYENQISSLNLTKNTQLKILSCSNNTLETLDLSKNTALTVIWCSYNHLKTLDLSKQTALTNSTISPQNSTDDLLILSNTMVGMVRPAGDAANYYQDMTLDDTKTMTTITMDGVNYLATLGWNYQQVMNLLAAAKSFTYNYNTMCATPRFANQLMQVNLSTTPYLQICSGNFPDANFRTAVGAFSGASDKKFTLAELNAITSINVASKSIAKLDGLEYFTKITTLNCSGNSLTALNPNYHPSLRTVYCQDNQLVNMTFNQSKASLQTLNCSGNKFTTLTFTDFNALRELRCATQQNASLTKLTLPSGSGNALAILYCNGNSLTAIDVSKNTNLQTLGIYVNQIGGALNLTNHTALVNLYCDQNKLTSLTLPQGSGNNLQNVNCYINSLTGGLDASKNTKLVTLNCYNNPNLATLKLPTTRTLTRLWCFNNGLSGTLDVSYYTSMADLACRNNSLTALTLPNTTTLWRLHTSDNKLTTLDVSRLTGLTSFWCHNNHLRTLDLSKQTALTELNCANQTSTEDVSVFDFSKIGIYLPTGGKQANFLNMQVAGVTQAADVLTSSGQQYLVVNPTPTGDIDLYGKTVTYSYNTECASPNFANATMANVVVTTYPYVMWVNPNSKSVAGNYYSGTIVLDYDAVVPSGTEVYIITGLKATPREMIYDGTKYSLQQLNMTPIGTAGQVIPANTPVYVKSTTQTGLHAFGRNLTGATPVTVPSGNLLKGSATSAITGLTPYSILTLGREKVTREVGFWQYSGTTSAIHRCYLEASILNSTAASGAKGAVFCFDEGDEFGGTTDIGIVGADSSVEDQDTWYTINGVRLNGKPSKKGIYIHNGRKEVVR